MSTVFSSQIKPQRVCTTYTMLIWTSNKVEISLDSFPITGNITVNKTPLN